MNGLSTTARGPHLGSLLLVLIGALLWGVYWVPVRFLEGQGLPGIWAGLFLTAAAFVVVLVLYVARRTRRPDPVQICAAMLVGVAFALYGAAIAYTDVVRAILLFYLTPVWSILIECAFFGRKWHYKSALAIVAALVGILFIFRGVLPLDGIGAVGDWMSLAAGLAWSIASALLFSRGGFQPLSLSTWALGASVVVSGIVLFLIGSRPASVLGNPAFDLGGALLMSLLIGVVYVVPVMVVTLWGTSQFSAVTMGFLLTGEIVSGVASSALFLGERFGWPEVVGTALIILGASIEILWREPGSHEGAATDAA